MPHRTDEPGPSTRPRGWARLRRPVLLSTGVGLLAIGVVANLGRYQEPEAHSLDTDEVSVDQRYVAYLSQPDDGQTLDDPGDDEAGAAGQRHKGEEGKMGAPTSKSKSGLYALKGPTHQAATVDGVGGLGLVGTGRGGGGTGSGTIGLGNNGLIGKGSAVGSGYGRGGHFLASPYGAGSTEEYEAGPKSVFVSVAQDPKSTFSIDVDTAAYSNMRRHIRDHQLPPAAAVRIEELVNYFDYDYPQPTSGQPFSVTTEVGPCPWNPSARLVHIGLQGQDIAPEETPARNLVFLLDVSGSMSSPDKLPLVKRGLGDLVEQLDDDDRLSIVVYAGAAGVVLPPTRGGDHETIMGALQRLEAGGSTNGGAGIEAAYALAQEHFAKGGINRVILATDGDFNVGVPRDALTKLIEVKRRSGVFLSVLGFGRGNLKDHTMEQLADKGNGNYAYIDGVAEARKVLVEQAGSTLVTIAKDVKIQVEFDEDAVDRYRLVGYENRMLAHRDFDDDTKDAGEIGAGHTVTALYEVVPRTNAENDAHLMGVNLRYKQPDGRSSQRTQTEVVDRGLELDATSTDFRFSSAVALFGMALRRSEHLHGTTGYETAHRLAQGALGDDPMGRRFELVGLIEGAWALSKGEEPPPIPEPPAPASQPTQPEQTADEAAPPEPTDDDGESFALEVLRLLPPLLALPMFVLALRRPRRRRWQSLAEQDAE